MNSNPNLDRLWDLAAVLVEQIIDQLFDRGSPIVVMVPNEEEMPRALELTLPYADVHNTAASMGKIVFGYEEITVEKVVIHAAFNANMNIRGASSTKIIEYSFRYDDPNLLQVIVDHLVREFSGRIEFSGSIEFDGDE